MTTPTFFVRPVARLEAFEETTYSSSRAAACTRCRVASETWPLPLSARETVAVETPASWATSLIPGMHPPRRGNSIGHECRPEPCILVQRVRSGEYMWSEAPRQVTQAAKGI